MPHHDFRRLLAALDELNPAQIEDAQTKIRDLRRRAEAISEIEARTNRGWGHAQIARCRRETWCFGECREEAEIGDVQH